MYIDSICFYFQKGHVILAIWRPVSGTTYRLIGSNRLTISSDKANTLVSYVVPHSKRIAVQPNDIVGFHYDARSTKASRCRLSDDFSPAESPGLYPIIPLILSCLLQMI